MVPCTLITFESEVFSTVLCLLWSSRYTAVQIKNCSKSMYAIKVATMKNMMVLCVPKLLSETEVFITLLFQLYSTR